MEQSIAAMEEATPPEYECEYDDATITAADDDAQLESDLLAVEESLGLARSSIPFTTYNNTENAEEDDENAPDDAAEEEERGIDEMAHPPRGSSLLDHTHSSRRRCVYQMPY